ncbi:MAG TPA: response regulator [Ktedonobacteraceae bacterium]|jgi:CheY-like chemotaxis protein|nr:response regulator [Ktedonobacteraceae bacterium]
MFNDEEHAADDRHKNMKTILVVEDEATLGDFLVEAISQETPHRAVLVADGSRALDIIQRVKPDLLILDYHLPDTNGIELYDRLHAIEGFEQTPALLLTAGVLRYNFHRRNIVGMSKPVELSKLLDLIEDLLQR